MKSVQNLQNHARYVPLYHFVTFGLIFAALVLSVVNLFSSGNLASIPAWFMVIVCFALVLGTFYGRAFALRAQDRAIRAEESLRYFILTGKRMPSELRMGQIVALRFAPDEEFAGLVDAALSEKLNPQQIKERIQNWRPDHNRA